MSASAACDAQGLPRNAMPLVPGEVQLRKTPRPHSDRYYLYMPRQWLPERTVVAVHGISRGAREQVSELMRAAQAHRAMVVAPLFDQDRFGDYQRLGRRGIGERADRALQRVLADVETAVATALTPFSVFGYSGGGQFAHRYALAHPAHVRRAVIAAAGWFTLPDESQPFPKGTGPTSRLADLQFDLDGLLRIPTLVVASRNDTNRDPALRRRKQLDKSQGRNRLERAQRWVRAMRRAARARGIEPVYRFRSLAHSDHDFVTAVRRDNLDELIFNYLFDTSSQNQPETMT